MTSIAQNAPTISQNVPTHQIFTRWKQQEEMVVATIRLRRDQTYPDRMLATALNPFFFELSKEIAKYHLARPQPYFYSYTPVKETLESRQWKETLQQTAIGVLCVAVSFFILLKAVGNQKLKKTWKAQLVTSFCLASSYFLGYIGYGHLASKVKDTYIVVKRSKDIRPLPTNFKIDSDNDPLTQEPISQAKLRSPQVVYFPNYVVDAKYFMLALLLADRKDFVDTVYPRMQLTEDQRSNIKSQVYSIFNIRKDLNIFEACTEIQETSARELQKKYPQRHALRMLTPQRFTAVQSALASAPGNSQMQTYTIQQYITQFQTDENAWFRVKAFEYLTGISLGFRDSIYEECNQGS